MVSYKLDVVGQSIPIMRDFSEIIFVHQDHRTEQSTLIYVA